MPYRQWHLRAALHGLAVLRIGTTASDEDVAVHLEGMAVSPETIDPALERIIGGAERGVGAGYERWAPKYDEPGNPLIAHEQPVAHEIMATWAAGSRVLDAACGTGRHSAHLAESGHRVTGVDASPWMLARAAKKRGDLTLVEGRTDALPFPDGAFDAAVCALMFDHLPRIDHTIGELARVVHPGGRILISNIHPTMALVGAHAAFRDVDDNPHFIRSHHHPVSSYFDAFTEHDLTVTKCVEPCWTLTTAKAQFGFVPDVVARDAIVGLPMALVWELTK